MTEAELYDEDRDLPQLALEALKAASQRAKESGRARVFRVKDKLVRVDSSGTTELKSLPPRIRVAAGTKKVKQ